MRAPRARAEPVLRVSRIVHPVTVLGPGRRLVIWVQGCGLACAGCMSRDTWDPAGGTGLPVTALAAACRGLLVRGADGVTVSGGEPLDQAPALAALLAALRPALRHAVDILVYTGYETDEALRIGAAVLRHADAVITGRYDAARPTRLVWRGSANQSLLPLTGLGRRRYAEHLDREADPAPLEIFPDGDGLQVVGVPQRGDLRRLETGLAREGAPPRTVSWRPARPTPSSPTIPPSRRTEERDHA
ncbi:4Fe-4S single cluster domain-containing protein [Actinomadura napierensis]|uniref:4Fe-4S cluster-binding domain-containing protein n=1 Tax=Actinomadura napierensis TaxID=267854 RepID=A0ABN2YK53_9ACTN